jgi:hypothetical protein
LAGALLLAEKIRQSAALFWFGLRIFGFLQIFILTSLQVFLIFKSKNQKLSG